MSLVLDNSVALAWCFEDEQTPAGMDLLDRVAETGTLTMLLWPLEALNGSPSKTQLIWSWPGAAACHSPPDRELAAAATAEGVAVLGMAE